MISSTISSNGFPLAGDLVFENNVSYTTPEERSLDRASSPGESDFVRIKAWGVDAEIRVADMKMTGPRLAILIVGALFTINVVIPFVVVVLPKLTPEYRRKGEQREALRRQFVHSVGDVDLDPHTTTFGRLKEVFHGPGVSLGSGSVDTRRLGWGCSTNENGVVIPPDSTTSAKELCAVEATFVCEAHRELDQFKHNGWISSPPPDTANPIEISIRPPFEGSMQGIHLTDSPGEVLKGRSPTECSEANDTFNFSSKGERVNWKDGWEAIFVVRDNKMQAIGLRDCRIQFEIVFH